MKLWKEWCYLIVTMVAMALNFALMVLCPLAAPTLSLCVLVLAVCIAFSMQRIGWAQEEAAKMPVKPVRLPRKRKEQIEEEAVKAAAQNPVWTIDPYMEAMMMQSRQQGAWHPSDYYQRRQTNWFEQL